MLQIKFIIRRPSRACMFTLAPDYDVRFFAGNSAYNEEDSAVSPEPLQNLYCLPVWLVQGIAQC